MVSQVAVMVALPAATPVTRPLPFTVACAVLSLDQVTTRPVSGVPPPSLGVAVSWTVLPTLTLAGAGVTVTEATGTPVTVITEVPVLPSQVAVMSAPPAATPDTRPLPLTVASAVLSLDQVTVRPVIGAPAASFGVAVRLTEPAVTIVAEGGVTATEATGVGPTGGDFEQEPSAIRTTVTVRMPAYFSRSGRFDLSSLNMASVSNFPVRC